MIRRKFTPAQKRQVRERQRGRCGCGKPKCGAPLDGTEEYDHVLELALGGKDELENMQALLPRCHKEKTAQRIKMVRKADRQKRHHETGRSSRAKPKRILSKPMSHPTLRRRMDGKVVVRS